MKEVARGSGHCQEAKAAAVGYSGVRGTRWAGGDLGQICRTQEGVGLDRNIATIWYSFNPRSCLCLPGSWLLLYLTVLETWNVFSVG